MTSVGGINSNLYSYSPNSSLPDPVSSSSNTTSDDNAATVSTGTDTVSISAEGLAAANRDFLGLPATGILTRSDFEGAAAEQEENVSSLLTSAMEALGIDSDQQVTLSLDDDNNIVIKESFTGRDELEKALNDDKSFIQAFTGLSANNEILDYADSLQTSSVSLADFLYNDTSESDLYSLASKYESIKSAGSSLESLWRMGRSENPYSYVYNEG